MVGAFLWFTACLAYVWFFSPMPVIRYSIKNLYGVPVLTNKCNLNDGVSFVEIPPSMSPALVELCFKSNSNSDRANVVSYSASYGDDPKKPLSEYTLANGSPLKVGQTVLPDHMRMIGQLVYADENNRAAEAESAVKAIKAVWPKGVPSIIYWEDAFNSDDVIAYMNAEGKWLLEYGPISSDIEKQRRSFRFENFKVVAVFALLGILLGWLFVYCIGWIVRGFLGISRGSD